MKETWHPAIKTLLFRSPFQSWSAAWILEEWGMVWTLCLSGQIFCASWEPQLVLLLRTLTFCHALQWWLSSCEAALLLPASSQTTLGFSSLLAVQWSQMQGAANRCFNFRSLSSWIITQSSTVHLSCMVMQDLQVLKEDRRGRRGSFLSSWPLLGF